MPAAAHGNGGKGEKPGRRSGLVDLHLHSSCSDGIHSPAELARLVAANGSGLVSLTDHDTLAGTGAFRLEARALGLAAIPGLEISSRCLRSGAEVHLLAYGIDPGRAALEDFLDEIRRSRRERFHRMVWKLGALGLEVDLDPLEGVLATGSAGRPHLAQQLYRQGRVGGIQEAFDRYLRNGGPAFVEKRLPGTGRAIDLVHACGGLVLIAHPGKTLASSTVEQVLRQGADGLEVWHPGHRAPQRREFAELVESRGLSSSAGSDYHGRPDGSERYLAPRIEVGRLRGKLAGLARAALEGPGEGGRRFQSPR